MFHTRRAVADLLFSASSAPLREIIHRLTYRSSVASGTLMMTGPGSASSNGGSPFLFTALPVMLNMRSFHALAARKNLTPNASGSTYDQTD